MTFPVHTMTDPLSIVGTATGLALGTLGFMLQTIALLEQAGRDYRNYPGRLSDFKRQLWQCEAQLEDWKTRWDGFSDKAYKEFWGDSYEEIKNWCADTGKLCGEIGRELRGEGSKGNSGKAKAVVKRAWSVLTTKGFSKKAKARLKANGKVSTVANGQPTAGSKQITPIQKIAFALYKSGKLRQQLDDLSKAIDNLDKFSRIQFRRQQRSNSTNSPTKEELKRAKRLMEFVEGLTNFAGRVHEVQKGLDSVEKTRLWALELRLPDNKGNAFEWDKTDKIDIDFALHVKDQQSQWASRRIRVYHYRSSDLDVAFLTKAITEGLLDATLGSKGKANQSFGVLNPSTGQRSHSYRKLLQDGILRDKEVYKAWEGDRANLIFGFINWTILLWGTNWTTHPCCCGLRFEQISLNDRQHTLTAVKDDCHGDLGIKKKLLLLGMTLAELTMARSLQIDKTKVASANESNIQFIVNKGKGHKTISRDRVLQKIRKRSGSDRFTEAVAYCLDNESVANMEDFRASFIDHYIRNIFEP